MSELMLLHIFKIVLIIARLQLVHLLGEVPEEHYKIFEAHIAESESLLREIVDNNQPTIVTKGSNYVN